MSKSASGASCSALLTGLGFFGSKQSGLGAEKELLNAFKFQRFQYPIKAGNKSKFLAQHLQTSPQLVGRLSRGFLLDLGEKRGEI